MRYVNLSESREHHQNDNPSYCLHEFTLLRSTPLTTNFPHDDIQLNFWQNYLYDRKKIILFQMVISGKTAL